jgi:hypothetical protein
MSLLDFHCDFVSVVFRFSLDDFDKSGFLKAVEIENEQDYVDPEGDFNFRATFRSRIEPQVQHGHLTIILYNEKGLGRASFDFHQIGEHGDQNRTGPFLEDAPSWLGQFIKKHDSPIRITTAYVFGKEFSTTIPLPFPLVTSNKRLSGLKVSGLSLQFPPEDRVEDAILQHKENETYLFLVAKSEAKLLDFDLERELETQNDVVKSLTKREKSNATEQSIPNNPDEP